MAEAETRVEVIQADRDAALKVRALQLGYAVNLPNDAHYLIQAFARHRLAGSAAAIKWLRDLDLAEKPATQGHSARWLADQMERELQI